MRVRIVLDCVDLNVVATFWSAAAGYERLPEWEDGYVSLRPVDPRSPGLLLQRVPEAKSIKNRLHLDLHPEQDTDPHAEIDRLVELGARTLGPVNEEFAVAHGTHFQVMADPEVNEFCLVWRDAAAAWD